MLRDGYDEKMIIDPENLQFLFQGRDPASGGNYSLLPYRLGLLGKDDGASTEILQSKFTDLDTKK
jgi:hypothetical protein